MRRLTQALVGAGVVGAAGSGVCGREDIQGPSCTEQETYRGGTDASNFWRAEYRCEGQKDLLYKRAKGAVEEILGRPLTDDECRESFSEVEIDGKRMMEINLLRFQPEGLNNFNIGGSTGTDGKVYIDGQGGMKCHTYPNGKLGGDHTGVVTGDRVALTEIGVGDVRVVRATCSSSTETSTSEAAKFASAASRMQEPGSWTRAAMAGALAIVAERGGRQL